MSEQFDFNGVEAAKNASYLAPGTYSLSISAVKYETPKDKNPYLNVTFTNKDGGSVNEKFYITPKTLPRLQYLHERWFGKRLEKIFTSSEQIAAYFSKFLLEKKITKGIIVGGQYSEDGSKVYAGLPYTDFIIPEGQAFEESPFEEGSKTWNAYVRKNPKKSAAANSDETVLASGSSSSDEMPMPW